jgi:hypothetical protein
MEGLIPFVYKAIMQYKNGNEGQIGSWFSESPSAAYMRLPGDSGRFQTSDIQLFRSDCRFSNTSSPSSRAPSTTTQIIVSSGVQSPLSRLTPRRVASTWSTSHLACLKKAELVNFMGFDDWSHLQDLCMIDDIKFNLFFFAFN